MGRSLKNISLNGSRNSVVLPKGTTAAQPTSAVGGMLRFNTTLNQLEYYNGTTWKQLQGGAGGVSTITRDAFTMDGSTLTYGPLSFTPTADQNVLVFIEGVFQHDGKYVTSATSYAGQPGISVNTTSILDTGATLSVIHGFDSI